MKLDGVRLRIVLTMLAVNAIGLGLLLFGIYEYVETLERIEPHASDALHSHWFLQHEGSLVLLMLCVSVLTAILAAAWPRKW